MEISKYILNDSGHAVSFFFFLQCLMDISNMNEDMLNNTLETWAVHSRSVVCIMWLSSHAERRNVAGLIPNETIGFFK
jgi:hypothetical protein